jgi:tetraacyldisaccharide 4'-kinase
MITVSNRRIQRPALLPFSLVYGLAVIIRNLLFNFRILKQTRFKIPVISVGNITAGGTGKTPHVEYLVNLLSGQFRLAVLSRGYKRKTRNFVLASDKSGVSDIGDEALQIKKKFPHVSVAVDRNRVEGIKILTETIPDLDCIILDDAYQHRYVAPGLSILLIDFNRPVFEDILLPAGNLRESLRSIYRAQIIIVTKCPELLLVSQRSHFISKMSASPEQEIFFTQYVYGTPLPVFPECYNRENPSSYSQFQKSNVMLVTGIANPFPLKQFLNGVTTVSEEIAFADHHNFSTSDLFYIKKTYEKIKSREKYILVTEKDAIRLKQLSFDDKIIQESLLYVPIKVKFLDNNETLFKNRIHEFLKNHQ